MLGEKTTTIDQRQALGEAFPILGREYPDLLVLSPDTSRSTGAAKFREAFPRRFLCTGVSEMNTLCMAAGLALEGWRPLVAGFAMFVGGKAWEPLRNSIAYPRLKVIIVATHGGINVGPDGVTHQMVEDIALMRAIPGMTVLAPTDANQVLPVLRAALDHDGPVYVRLERHPMPLATDPEERYVIGKSRSMRQGNDLTLIGEGSMVFTALEAALLLAEQGIEAEVISAVSIKPLDEEAVLAAAERTGAIVAVEDHNRYGGLGSAVAEVLSLHRPCPIEQVALQDTYAESGEAEQLRVKYHLAVQDVVDAAHRVLRKRNNYIEAKREKGR
ncbi:MAG: transketolase family protein [Spirochaetaceae bacterium]|nr:MAG: transketolase family protein [Spirochaetaceae bacterium]